MISSEVVGGFLFVTGRIKIECMFESTPPGTAESPDDYKPRGCEANRQGFRVDHPTGTAWSSLAWSNGVSKRTLAVAKLLNTLFFRFNLHKAENPRTD